jgi:hypothetical protein
VPLDSQGIVKTLAAKLAGAELFGDTSEDPSSQVDPQPMPGASPPALHLSSPLAEELDRLTGAGMEILAALGQLAETRSDLFVDPGDKVARLLAITNEGQRNKPHCPGGRTKRRITPERRRKNR